MGLHGVARLLRGVPDCPICEGPCTHEFERSEFVIPDRLPKGEGSNPAPVKVAKANLRGRRAHHGPEENRAKKPDDDR